MVFNFFKKFFNNRDYTVSKSDKFIIKIYIYILSFFFGKARLVSLNCVNEVNINFLFNFMFYI